MGQFQNLHILAVYGFDYFWSGTETNERQISAGQCIYDFARLNF